MLLYLNVVKFYPLKALLKKSQINDNVSPGDLKIKTACSTCDQKTYYDIRESSFATAWQ